MRLQLRSCKMFPSSLLDLYDTDAFFYGLNFRLTLIVFSHPLLLFTTMLITHDLGLLIHLRSNPELHRSLRARLWEIFLSVLPLRVPRDRLSREVHQCEAYIQHFGIAVIINVLKCILCTILSLMFTIFTIAKGFSGRKRRVLPEDLPEGSFTYESRGGTSG